MSPNDFRPLPETFRHGGFDFRVVKRQGRVVLVQKTKAKMPNPMFEVALLRLIPEFTFPGKATTPAHEAMPRDEDFGKTACDFAYSRDRAEAAFARLAREASTQAAANDPDPRGGVLTPDEHQNSIREATGVQETAFQPLSETWNDGSWRFQLLKRSGMVALVAKSQGGRDAFEVVVIQRHAAHAWPDGSRAPARETMPSSEKWDTYGWSPYDLPAAEAKFAELATAGGAA